MNNLTKHFSFASKPIVDFARLNLNSKLIKEIFFQRRKNYVQGNISTEKKDKVVPKIFTFRRKLFLFK